MKVYIIIFFNIIHPAFCWLILFIGSESEQEITLYHVQKATDDFIAQLHLGELDTLYLGRHQTYPDFERLLDIVREHVRKPVTKLEIPE